MITIESKRKDLETILRVYLGAKVAYVTSPQRKYQVKSSTFYTHGRF